MGNKQPSLYDSSNKINEKINDPYASPPLPKLTPYEQAPTVQYPYNNNMANTHPYGN